LNDLVNKLVDKLPPHSVYPIGIVEPIQPQVRGRSFFPGGCGLFNGAEQPIPERPILLVGQDFGTLEYWRELGTVAEPEDGTWSSLRKLLGGVSIDPRRCFFTNALLGVRVASSIEGPSPGLASAKYVDACMTFLHEQVRIIRPLAVVTLGVVPTMLLARSLQIAPNLPSPTAKHVLTWKDLDTAVEPFVKDVNLTGAPPFVFASSVHPVRYWLNSSKRSWPSRGLLGVPAHDAIWSEVRRVLG